MTNLVLPGGQTIASYEAPTSTRVVAASWRTMLVSITR